MSSRWLLLGLANLCANAAAYEMAKNVELAEVGLAQPQVEEKLRERRSFATRSILPVILSLSAALLVTFVMLQCFKFLQGDENNMFLGRRLSPGLNNPCQRTNPNPQPPQEDMFGPYRRSELLKPPMVVDRIFLSELRKLPIEKAAGGKVQPNELSDRDLINFWEPNLVIPDNKKLGPFRLKDLSSPRLLDAQKIKLSELRKLPIHCNGVEGEVQNQLSDADIIFFWGGQIEEVVGENESDFGHVQTSSEPGMRLFGPFRQKNLSSPVKDRMATMKLSELRNLPIHCNGVDGEVQNHFNDRELKFFWQDLVDEIIED